MGNAGQVALHGPTFLYVDTPVPAGLMHNALAAGRFGDVKIQKSTLRDTVRANLPVPWVMEVLRPEALPARLAALHGSRVVVWPAQVVTLSAPRFRLLMEKLEHAQYPLRVAAGGQMIFAGPAEAAATDGARLLGLEREDYLLALESMADLQRLFSVNIHSRYFNDVVARGEVITKTSSNKGKIKAEYDFLSSVPETLQGYFVPVRNYREGKDRASYDMPKLPMLDASVRFINGNLRGTVLETFLDHVGGYLRAAGSLRKPATAETYGFIADKCMARLEELKAWKGFAQLDAFVAAHTEHAGVEAAFARLMALLERERKAIAAAGQVFSHGDLCLSNMLYDEQAGLLQLIDPRGGAASGSYRSVYYDLAKLSHSLLGGYDHIVNGVAAIGFDDGMRARVVTGIEGSDDVEAAFGRLVADIGVPLRLVRLVEASLFLSMLPLHVDSVRKVHVLALRGIEILREVKGG